MKADEPSGGSSSATYGSDPLFSRRGRGGPILALLAACTAVGVLFATHFRIYYRIEWPLALWWGLKDWYLWGALAPAVVWLSRRVPLTRRRWPQALALHALAGLCLAVVHPFLAVSLSALAEGLGDVPFLESVERLFWKRYTLSFTTYVAIAALAHAADAQRRFGTREQRAGRLTAGLREAPVPSPAEPAERLLVRRADRERFLPVERIDRIEAEGNYVRIHAGEETYLERRTLRSLEAQLDPARFLRIHRSHIVNVERIDRIEATFKGGYQVVLRDGTRLALSRTYRKRLEGRVGESF